MVLVTDQESEIHYSMDNSPTFGCMVKYPINTEMESKDELFRKSQIGCTGSTNACQQEELKKKSLTP